MYIAIHIIFLKLSTTKGDPPISRGHVFQLEKVPFAPHGGKVHSKDSGDHPVPGPLQFSKDHDRTFR